MKKKISSGVADYIVDYVTSLIQKHQADVLVVDWENNTHGAVFGIAVSRSMDTRRVPNAANYSNARSF